MTLSTLVRKAQRIIETTECEDAAVYAARALKAAERDEVEEALEDLNYAEWMSA